jgi:hypothetical protein
MHRHPRIAGGIKPTSGSSLLTLFQYAGALHPLCLSSGFLTFLVHQCFIKNGISPSVFNRYMFPITAKNITPSICYLPSKGQLKPNKTL